MWTINKRRRQHHYPLRANPTNFVHERFAFNSCARTAAGKTIMIADTKINNDISRTGIELNDFKALAGM
jgi:hypothetical protein